MKSINKNIQSIHFIKGIVSNQDYRMLMLNIFVKPEIMYFKKLNLLIFLKKKLR